MNTVSEATTQESLQLVEKSKGHKPILPPISKSHSSRVDHIPKHLLVTLKQTGKIFEDLGPGGNKKERCAIKRPANVWNHVKQREKFKHLIDQPACYCGAGLQDISYLLDAPQENKKNTKEKQPSEKKLEKTSLEEHSKNHIPETIIPNEFHVVKHKGVAPIDIVDDKYVTAPSSHDKHLTVFPSMKPSGRQEALQLMQTMNNLLEKAGVKNYNNHIANVEDTDDQPCDSGKQIEELLTLVKSEQKIYNIIFHEVIRQVSIECIERGNVLAELRNRYAQILDRVPKQVKSLHEEVIAQRALDRRLTEELARFKTSITLLTKELHEVHAHDEEVTRQAIQTQSELNDALRESEKNASLLAEYHDLYELQRRRLDYQLSKLIEERDLWSGSTHMLSLKVTKKHNLVTVRRLHLYEKAWYKWMNRFALLLTQTDDEQLHLLTNHVRDWQNVAFSFHDKLCDAESGTYRKLTDILKKLNDWSIKFEHVVTPDEGTVHPLQLTEVQTLFDVLKSWEEVFNIEAERFTGDTLLSCEDDLLQLNNCIDNWVEVALKIFANHPMQDGSNHPQHLTMLELNKKVMSLHHSFQLRMSGENGVARGIIHMVNTLDTWVNKLNVLLNGGETLFDSEWVQLADFLQVQWKDNVNSIIRLLSYTNDFNDFNTTAGALSPKRTTSQDSWASNVADVVEIVTTTQEWLDSTVDAFQIENSNVIEQIDTTHSNMIRWMVTVLIKIAPNMENTDIPDNTAEEDETKGLGASILMESTPSAILDKATILFNWLRSLTDLIGGCCKNFVLSSSQDDNNNDLDKVDNLKDLQKIEGECQGWMNTANLLLKDISNQIIPIEEFKPAKLTLPVSEQDPLTPLESSRPNTTTTSITVSNELINESDVIEVVDQLPSDTHDLEHVSDSPQVLKIDSENTSTVNDSKDVLMHVIGPDENVRKQPMKTTDENMERLSTSDTSRKDVVISSMSLEALTTLENLQEQLLKTEERAQNAETRAFKAESLLKEAQERIRALERTFSRSSTIPVATETPVQTPLNKTKPVEKESTSNDINPEDSKEDSPP